ncbi:hypothetical protein ACEPAF_8658 [Sanghuangporus sanghuang]
MSISSADTAKMQLKTIHSHTGLSTNRLASYILTQLRQSWPWINQIGASKASHHVAWNAQSVPSFSCEDKIEHVSQQRQKRSGDLSARDAAVLVHSRRKTDLPFFPLATSSCGHFFFGSRYYQMAASLDQLSTRLVALRSNLSDLMSSTSLSSLSGSGSSSSSLVCPSLTASSTLSSEGFSELETDLDTSDFSPVHSSFAGAAYDLTCQLLGPLDEFKFRDEVNLPDLATPRPLLANRRSYFTDLGEVQGEWYESGSEAEVMVGKWRRGAFKRSKANSFVKSGRRKPIARRHTSGILRANSSFSPDTPARTNCSVRMRPNSKARKSYVDLGLGHPTTWSGEATPKADDGLSGTKPTNKLVKQGRRESPMKIVLKPMDSVLAFVQTPSPIESLPSPVWSGFPGLEVSTAQGLHSNMTPPRNSADSVPQIGLGFIDVAAIGHVPAQIAHGCPFKQCADYSLP